MKKQQGFTLIEILIVVAIIAILASIVIVGLAPAQQSGRDARRVSDLQSIRNALQIYYSRYGIYPGSAAGSAASDPASWSAFQGVFAQFNISNIPQDPSSNRSYSYWPQNHSAYVLGAALENKGNAVFSSYRAPSTTGNPIIDSSRAIYASSCSGTPTGGASTDADYCTTL